MDDRLQALGARLDTLFKQQVSAKALLEERWLQDIRQYNGEYEDDVLQRIRESGGSEAFLNITRVKCNATEARLVDMLLPTDDRNWGIEPSPMPELGDGDVDAKRKSDAMQQVMDDQLAECSYNAKLRQVIHNMVVFGTGVLKGPVIRNRVTKRFRQSDGIDEAGMPVRMWEMVLEEDLRPGAECVSPWDFFPDMRAARMEDAEFVFQRHRLTRQKLRELAKLPGFLPEQIELVLAMEPSKTFSGMVVSAESSDSTAAQRAGYEAIEYHGEIEAEDLRAAGVEVPEGELRSYRGTVWICNGIVLKAALSLLDDGELMYDCVPFERDDTWMFGFGVPYMLRSSQRAINASWRMILDNARLSVGGQVVFKKGKVRPVNGDWRLSHLKEWEIVDPNAAVNDVFGVIPIQAQFGEMFRILEASRQFADEETGLPMIAQGQQSPAITKTAQGMAILMNSANTLLRRLVKEFDDHITTPFIGRLYRWNMQYGDNDDIKGDFHVVALGSSSLLIKEQQTQGLMQLSQIAASNPEFARRTKWDELYRQIVRAMSINAEGVVKTDQELEQEPAPQGPPIEVQMQMAELELKKAELMARQAQAQAEMQMKQAQAQAEMAIAQAKTDTERQKVQASFEAERMQAMASLEAARADFARVQVERELALLKLAAEREMTVEQIRAQFGLQSMKVDAENQRLAAELAVKMRTGSGV